MAIWMNLARSFRQKRSSILLSPPPSSVSVRGYQNRFWNRGEEESTVGFPKRSGNYIRRDEIKPAPMNWVIQILEKIPLILTSINEAVQAWGLRCLPYEIRDIHPPRGVSVAKEIKHESEDEKKSTILWHVGSVYQENKAPGSLTLFFQHRLRRFLCSSADTKAFECPTCYSIFIGWYSIKTHQIRWGHDQKFAPATDELPIDWKRIPPWMIQLDDPRKDKYKFLCSKEGCKSSTGKAISRIGMLTHIKSTHKSHWTCPICLAVSEDWDAAVKHQEDWEHSCRPRRAEDLILIYRNTYG